MTVTRRPFTVTILIAIVLIIAVMNFIRVLAALLFWETLTNIGMSPGPLYIALTGIFWAIAGMALIWSLWIAHPKTKAVTMGFVLLYVIYSWIDRFLFQSSIQRENTPFALIASILVVFYTVFTLLLPSNQNYLLRKNEQ